jgi:uncharacterized protein
MKISDIGFEKGSITECIVTTYNRDKSPNAAPMGVFTLRDGVVVLRVHTDTDTYSNLTREKRCALNVVFDPYLFLKTAITGRGDGGKEREIDAEDVVGETGMNANAPVLKEAFAVIQGELLGHKKYVRKDRYGTSEVAVVKLRVIDVIVLKAFPKAVNRGLYAAVELAVELSRGKTGNKERYLKVMKRSLRAREYRRIQELLSIV